MESSGSLQAIIKNLIGGSNTYNILQLNQQNNVENQQVEYVTIEQAREIIQSSQQAIDKSDEIKYLESQYDLGALPEVVAVNQTGVDTSKEGLSLNKTEINAIIDNYKGAIESSSKEHHELRREIENNIDPDEEDPELDLYEEIEEEDDFSASKFLLPQ